MKISVNWMQELAGKDVQILPKGGIEELVAKIGAQLGAVEEVVDLGKKYQGIVIAKVVSCEKHPNADKLHVCKIDDGSKTKDVERDKDGYVQVVCGAPNVKAGLLVAWLPPKSTVPATYDKGPFVLEARDLRGVISNGMLASASELALSDDHDGILELDQGKAGDDFAEIFGLNDYIIDIENKMFTHRPDLFGQLGVAREIAGITGQVFKSPKVYVNSETRKQRQETKGLQLKVENKAGKLVPCFVAQVFENVSVGQSPVRLQTYLMRVGIRPINNIVDITNYYMMLTAQPLHAYDYDKLLKVSGLKSASLEARQSKKGEKIKLLNSKELTLQDDQTILITSNDVPVGVGGVMGGADTEVDESTKNIVVESASFDMYNIRKTAMKYGLFTDAVTRFNKGQSPLQCNKVLAWAQEQIVSDSGGVAGAIKDSNPDVKNLSMVRASTEFINSRLGLELTADDMQKLLENVEFDIERTDNKDELKVTPPFWRTDIEIPEDVVEEIGRLYGFDHMPLVLPKRSARPTAADPTLQLKQRIREILAKGGANEILTYSFVHGDLLQRVGQDTKDAFKLSNALSPELQYYRQSLTPSLLEKIHPNVKAGYDNFALFELNKSHIKGQNDPEDKAVPKEFNNLALVVTASDKIKTEGAAYFQARHYLDYLAHSLGVELRYEPLTDAPAYPAAAPYDHTRSARVYHGEKLIGLVGEFKASVRRALKLPAHTAGFEIGISTNLITTTSHYKPLSKYPSVSQDTSLKVPAGVTYHQVYEALASELLGKPDTSAQLTPLDLYQRADDADHMQMTFRLKISNYEKTMKSEEVNKLLDNAATAAKTKLGAERL